MKKKINRFKFKKLPLKGLIKINTLNLSDHRGNFTRLFCSKELRSIGWRKSIAQVNHSYTSQKGTVRGLHYQKPPHSEIKIINCIKGAVWDVSVDLRKNSPTFLKWHSEIISEDSNCSLLIPEGFAHGFQCLTNDVHMIYINSKEYHSLSENGLNPSDPFLSIKWPLKIRNLSFKNQNYISLTKNFIGL